MTPAQQPLSDHQKLGVIQEFRTAYGLVKYGLGALQTIDGANDFYHPPFLLLASGLERVCKCVLAFKHLADNGTLPSVSTFKDWGHDVVRLLRDVADTCFSKRYLRCAAARADIGFLQNDAVLREVISCLAYYGAQGRYDDLNLLAGATPDVPLAQERWDALEMAIMREDPNWSERIVDPSDDMYPEINRRIVATIEKLARALTRLFTIGRVHDDAKRFLSLGDSFLLIHDDKLGTTDYRSTLHKGPWA